MTMGLLGVVAVGGLAIRYSMAANETTAGGMVATSQAEMSHVMRVTPAATVAAMAPPAVSSAVAQTEVTYSRQPLWLQRPRGSQP
jgi:Tfp pilus assembly protein PilV